MHLPRLLKKSSVALLPLLVVTLASCTRDSASPDDPPSEEAKTAAEISAAPEGMAFIPGGIFLMGSESGLPRETPLHEVFISPFYLDTHEVTNDEFAAFVAATGFVSEAERWGWSLGFDPTAKTTERVPGAEWWVKVDRADWRHPLGAGSSIEGQGDYPVVQVSWNDAVAYCEWADKRLPTEAEWEFASRGALEQNTYAWGNAFQPDGQTMANVWEGIFPASDSGADGYASLSPVGIFPANGYGLYDIGGNVWEWCSDWYESGYYRRSPRDNPQGPERALEKVLRGGSWLCAPNYCHGYRNSHRNHSGIDTGLNHVGFRCARSVAEAALAEL